MCIPREAKGGIGIGIGIWIWIEWRDGTRRWEHEGHFWRGVQCRKVRLIPLSSVAGAALLAAAAAAAGVEEGADVVMLVFFSTLTSLSFIAIVVSFVVVVVVVGRDRKEGGVVGGVEGDVGLVGCSSAVGRAQEWEARKEGWRGGIGREVPGLGSGV